MNQQDLRVIKTKKNIEESFLRLLEKKSFSEITVQNILDEALINRSTFYKHYSDKYDLARLLSDVSGVSGYAGKSFSGIAEQGSI